MNFPGFNAEAALYKTGERYHIVRPQSHLSAAIYPQVIDKKCFNECHLKCIEDHCPHGG